MNRLSLFQELLSNISERGLALLGPASDAAPDVDDLVAGCDALLSSRGEASGVAYARRVLRGFTALDEDARLEFYRVLASRYQPEVDEVKAATEAYLEAQNPDNLQRLLRAVEPPRQELFRRLNLAPGGTATLVRMREGLLKHLKEDPSLRSVDADMAHLFESWFNRGFLVLRRIDWQTPAHILEKIIAYEAVHEINGWDELRRRVDPADRRCFAFFHPALGDDPLIFVEVALTTRIPATIEELLDDSREQLPVDEARTAVFYSISNCQSGLRGVSLGNFLIKQVAEELRSELPNLKRFVTLSPVPGFMSWLRNPESEMTNAAGAALDAISKPDWHHDETAAGRARDLLLPLAAHYLLKVKRPDGLPVDPVERFHLGNGASLDRLNWLANLSEPGLRQSAGIMVNYLYNLDKIEANHEDYVDRRRIPSSRQVRSLVSGKRSEDNKERSSG
ncbi:MAG TPA: malonyl-CoA decarboxylase [Arenicellales bacterium]|nr:malonyl-CoA decarboxylase [Arenicellales bacterium]